MKIISFKVKETVYNEIQKEANKYGLSISAWLRLCILTTLNNKKL